MRNSRSITLHFQFMTICMELQRTDQNKFPLPCRFGFQEYWLHIRILTSLVMHTNKSMRMSFVLVVGTSVPASRHLIELRMTHYPIHGKNTFADAEFKREINSLAHDSRFSHCILDVINASQPSGSEYPQSHHLPVSTRSRSGHRRSSLPVTHPFAGLVGSRV